MVHLIDKDVLITEINKRRNKHFNSGGSPSSEYCYEDDEILNIIDTLEVKDVDTWHLQEKEDIYDAVKGWDIHTFVCVMKDGTIQKFTGCRDEDYEGCITTYIDGVNDDYDDVDDIVKWIEV